VDDENEYQDQETLCVDDDDRLKTWATENDYK